MLCGASHSFGRRQLQIRANQRKVNAVCVLLGKRGDNRFRSQGYGILHQSILAFMALTQMQLIQSLGEAMAWLERELNWGVPATELRHLCGRIGELYAALITNGQMAVAVNQHGYDVVSAQGERISVKTTAMTSGSGHIAFNRNTLNQVDRVIILRVNTEEMQIETLLDAPVEVVISMVAGAADNLNLSLSRLLKRDKARSEIKATKEVQFQNYTIRELETGTIELEQNDQIVHPVKPALRDIAIQLNVPFLNSNGNAFNTRQLGSQVIKSLEEMTHAGDESAPNGV